MLTTFLDILHLLVCIILMAVVLLQPGRSGGMGPMLGGGAAQVFGGSGAGNLLTRATAVCAALFMITSVSLAFISSSGDRALKAKAAMEAKKKAEHGTERPRDADDKSHEKSGDKSHAPEKSAPSPSPAPAK